ncbi:uncharacterized protein MKZ38_001379 [Zalerion maritima]|uniref:Uncharacterized protein n=1 Tax=Zalerion maritima TaxID=339359 RepID=A0AAD5WT94_9PEZI|nr:uncharacterized protein MKZ38_001379 [Zalerion maritima]
MAKRLHNPSSSYAYISPYTGSATLPYSSTPMPISRGKAGHLAGKRVIEGFHHDRAALIVAGKPHISRYKESECARVIRGPRCTPAQELGVVCLAMVVVGQLQQGGQRVKLMLAFKHVGSRVEERDRFSGRPLRLILLLLAPSKDFCDHDQVLGLATLKPAPVGERCPCNGRVERVGEDVPEELEQIRAIRSQQLHLFYRRPHLENDTLAAFWNGTLES